MALKLIMAAIIAGFLIVGILLLGSGSLWIGLSAVAVALILWGVERERELRIIRRKR